MKKCEDMDETKMEMLVELLNWKKEVRFLINGNELKKIGDEKNAKS